MKKIRNILRRRRMFMAGVHRLGSFVKADALVLELVAIDKQGRKTVLSTQHLPANFQPQDTLNITYKWGDELGG